MIWPSGLRRQLKALVRKGVGSNPTAIIVFIFMQLYTFIFFIFISLLTFI